MSICTLHYTQPHIPNTVYYMRTAHLVVGSRENLIHLPTLHAHLRPQPCVWGGRWGQRRRSLRAPPARTFMGIFRVGLCVVLWRVPIVRVSAVWWSRVRMGRGDWVRGGSLVSDPPRMH